MTVSRVHTTKAHDTPKARSECSSDGRDGYLALRSLSFRRVLLTSSPRYNTYSFVCKTEAGFRRNKGGSCGAQQATKVVKPQMVRREGSRVCTGHQQAVLAEKEQHVNFAWPSEKQ